MRRRRKTPVLSRAVKYTLYLVSAACLLVVAASVFPNIIPDKKHTGKSLKSALGLRREVWGIDLSHHQSSVNWESLADESPDFVFIKATEGTTHLDTKFEENWERLKKLHLRRGAYHFFSYKSDGTSQALNFINTVSLKSGDLPPVLDAEFRHRIWSPDKVAHELQIWLDMVEKHFGVTPIIYTNEPYYNKYIKGRISDRYPLWIANYKGEPSVEWTFWQHTDQHSINGVRGGVDRNVFKDNISNLEKLEIP
jgi:lysozyme